jgi:predicted molibdopterin-dependent oxidoreductase YjgC
MRDPLLNKNIDFLWWIKRENDKSYLNYKLMRDPLLNKNIDIFSPLYIHTLLFYSLEASFFKGNIRR